MAAPVTETVSDEQLNRATLARQLLLHRAKLDPVTAVSRLCALQAQEPASPYLALWTRLADFDPRLLDEAIRTGEIVKTTAMRVTLHLLTAEDYPAFWAAHADYIRRARTGMPRFPAGAVPREQVDHLVASAVAFATAEPRSNAEMRAHLEGLAGAFVDQGWWWAVRPFAPVLRAPDDEPWMYSRRPSYVAPSTAPFGLNTDKALECVVLSYLAAFGPATLADIAQFTKHARAPMRAAFERLRPELRIFENTSGQELFDVPDGVIPAGETPAPARFLPMWDSVLLAYAGRSRIIPADVRTQVIRQNGDVLPTVLVDGSVAGVWLPADGAIQVKAFRPLPEQAWDELAAEATALTALIAPREPGVYRRYTRWWDAVPAEIVTLPG